MHARDRKALKGKTGKFSRPQTRLRGCDYRSSDHRGHLLRDEDVEAFASHSTLSADAARRQKGLEFRARRSQP